MKIRLTVNPPKDPPPLPPITSPSTTQPRSIKLRISQPTLTFSLPPTQPHDAQNHYQLEHQQPQPVMSRNPQPARSRKSKLLKPSLSQAASPSPSRSSSPFHSHSPSGSPSATTTTTMHRQPPNQLLLPLCVKAQQIMCKGTTDYSLTEFFPHIIGCS